MPRFPAQPCQKDADEHLGIGTIRLGSPVLARHRDARRMDDMNFDATRLQPPR